MPAAQLHAQLEARMHPPAFARPLAWQLLAECRPPAFRPSAALLPAVQPPALRLLPGCRSPQAAARRQGGSAACQQPAREVAVG